MSEAQTLNDAVQSASESLTAKHESGETKSAPEPRETRKAEPVKDAAPREPASSTDDDEDFGAPGWTKQWKKSSRSALRKLASYEGANELLPEVYKEIETRYDYTGKTQAEFERFRKRYEPYDNVLGSLEQRFALQGMHPAAGLQQMAAVSDLLQRDPDQALMMLASQFKPRDAKRLVEQFVKTFGVDLTAVTAEQPWVDPTVKGMLEPLQHQLQMMQQAEFQRRQQEFHANTQYVTGAIKAFTEAKDDTGDLKYPHYWRLDNAMATLFNQKGLQWAMSHPDPLKALYEEAMWMDPELREQLIEDRARKAEAKAIQDANSKSAEVDKAVRASRNVNGGPQAPTKKVRKSLDEIVAESAKSLSR